MRTRSQSNDSHLWGSSSGVTTRGLLQRKCGCGENCGGSGSQQVEDSSARSSISRTSRVAKQTRVGHDFSKVPVDRLIPLGDCGRRVPAGRTFMKS